MQKVMLGLHAASASVVLLATLTQEGRMRHTTYFPTPAFLEARVKLAQQLGAGLSIWELGQGMECFMDLL